MLALALRRLVRTPSPPMLKKKELGTAPMSSWLTPATMEKSWPMAVFCTKSTASRRRTPLLLKNTLPGMPPVPVPAVKVTSAPVVLVTPEAPARTVIQPPWEAAPSPAVTTTAPPLVLPVAALMLTEPPLTTESAAKRLMSPPRVPAPELMTRSPPFPALEGWPRIDVVDAAVVAATTRCTTRSSPAWPQKMSPPFGVGAARPVSKKMLPAVPATPEEPAWRNRSPPSARIELWATTNVSPASPGTGGLWRDIVIASPMSSGRPKNRVPCCWVSSVKPGATTTLPALEPVEPSPPMKRSSWQLELLVLCPRMKVSPASRDSLIGGRVAT
mmetsp:Transcript_10072/g.41043  ORF Transcript_10072/g.41043 Transcript_10072/m.41043 type:complete len:329 (-) Transcript_10072:1122-2108(-)